MSHKLFLTPSDTASMAVALCDGEGNEQNDLSGAGLAELKSDQQNSINDERAAELETIAKGIHWDWALYDAMGNRNASGLDATLDSVLHLIAQNDLDEVSVIGLLPACNIFRCNINIPSRAQRVIQQALPFAVEELVAQDIDSLHITTGDRDKKNDIPVIVVDKTLFSSLHLMWDLQSHALESIYADSQLLPLGGQEIVVLLSGGLCWLKTANAALQMTSSGLPQFIESWIEENRVAEQIIKLKIYQSATTSSDTHLMIAELQQINGIDASIEATSLSPVEFFAESYFHVNDAIDLCQGEFAIDQKTSANWRKWIGVAAVLCIWFCAEVVLNIGKGFYYDHKSNETLGLALAQYKTVFPNDRRVSESNVKKFMESKLRTVGQNAKGVDFLSVLGVTGAQYYKLPNANTVTFNSLNYNAQRGELNIELRAKSLEQLDQLKKGISSAGLDSKISSAVKEKDYIRGRISVSGS